MARSPDHWYLHKWLSSLVWAGWIHSPRGGAAIAETLCHFGPAARACRESIEFRTQCAAGRVDSDGRDAGQGEPGPYRDTALWGLRELGLTLADLGVKLLPAASAEEEAERAAHMLQVIEEAGDRVWDELRRPVTAPG